MAASRPSLRLPADRACDGDAFRHALAEQGATPALPDKRDRLNRFAFDRDAYRLRNAAERACRRLKDFHAVATRYDKLARNDLAGDGIAAALAFWIR